MTKNLEIDPSVWESCPPGEFQRTSARLALRDWRKNLAQRLGVAVFAIFLGGLAFQARSIAVNERNASVAGGISCSEVQQLANGQASEKMDSETSAKITAHLGTCRRCGPLSGVQIATLKARTDAAKAGKSCAVTPKPHCD